MIKLNYTVQTRHPRCPGFDTVPDHVTELVKDLTSWCGDKVSELMCLLGHENEPMEIKIEWVAEANYQMLVLTYNVGTWAETQRVFRIETLKIATSVLSFREARMGGHCLAQKKHYSVYLGSVFF